MRMRLYPTGCRALKGPMAGRPVPYATRFGVPVGELVEYGIAISRTLPTADPGMVVAESTTSQLYGIDSEGEAHFLGLALPRSPAVLEEPPLAAERTSRIAPAGYAVDVSSHDTETTAGYSRASFEVEGLTAGEIGRRVLEACAEDEG